MKIIIGDEDSYWGHSSELPWQRYRQALSVAKDLLSQADGDGDGADEQHRPGTLDIHDASVIAAMERCRRRGSTEKDQEHILAGCLAFWLTSPNIIATFDEMASTHDGRVQVTRHGLIADWVTASSPQ